MYTYNLFCCGIDLTKKENLANHIEEICEFEMKINGKSYELTTPYQGGLVSGDVFPIVFGTIITDDDHNKEYTNEIRNAKESDYKEEYENFVKVLVNEIKNDNLLSDKEIESVDNNVEQKEYIEDIIKKSNQLIDYIEKTEPHFYTMQVSS
jgi:hypothetical protein